jgi:hypothetical protein
MMISERRVDGFANPARRHVARVCAAATALTLLAALPGGPGGG